MSRAGVSHARTMTGARLLVATLTMLVSIAAHADLIEAVNTVRSRGCDGGKAADTPLRRSSELDAVAREWSHGGRLSAALSRTDYRATSSTSMHISGSRDDAKIAAILRRNYCDEIVNRQFQEIGIFRNKDDVWIVLAAPFAAPAMKDAASVRQRVLTLVNQARSRDRKCGGKMFRAVPPLTASAALNDAARVHAADMAKHNRFEHQGTDGSTPAERVERQGYRWAAVAENIAAGAQSADAVVQGWLESPGHCSNIMSPQYSQMGLAYVVDPNSKSGIYWSQVFAKPR